LRAGFVTGSGTADRNYGCDLLARDLGSRWPGGMVRRAAGGWRLDPQANETGK